MKQFSIILIVVALLFGSCNSETIKLSENDYLVFGHFYGECMGEGCVEIFRLEKDCLLEDTNDTYPSSVNFYNAKYINRSISDFEKTKDLLSYFPDDLVKENNTVIGQPDAGDWGGIYVEYNYNGVHKFWLIDKMKNNVPAKYHEFIDKITVKIQQLQK
ncbi:MAG: hypothetical protein Q7U47_12360 [Paludibacter sp.]|nr:hypothetical protein [Paludibacter sp.]